MDGLLGLGLSLTDLRGLGLGSLVTLTILSIFKGWLVPKPFYDEVKARAESERQAKEKAMEAASSLLEQNTLLIKKEDLAHAAVMAIRDRAELNRVVGGGETT